MKKLYRSLIIIVMAFPVFCDAQTGKKVTLKGDVSLVKESVVQVKISYRKDNNVVTDSCLVVEGKYTFNLDIDEAVAGTLVFQSKIGTSITNREALKKYVYQLYFEPQDMWVSSIGIAANCTVKGSTANTDYQQLLAAIGSVNKILVPLRDSAMNAYNLKDSITYEKLAAAYRIKSDSLMAKTGFDFALAHPNSAVVFDALAYGNGYPFNADRMKPVFDQLPLTVRNSAKGKALGLKIDNGLKVGIGKIAPDFTQASNTGSPISLSSFRGKYVLLDFWGSWCGPCRAESPYMVKAFNKFRENGFTIVAVTSDNEKEKWQEAIDKDGTGAWTHVGDMKGRANDVIQMYSIIAYPTNYLIDPKGKIIAQNLRGEDLEKKLAEIFK